ncbi:MAG TPA: tetratricopeptide repeat protein, partial [Pyrinomonadaceae bacterium]
PDMLLARYEAGKIYYDRGKLDEAVSELSKVVAADPTFRPAIETLAQARFKRGSVDEAIALLERAVALDPTWPNAFALLGRAYKSAGRLEEARKAFETAKRLSIEERKRLERAVSQP